MSTLHLWPPQQRAEYCRHKANEALKLATAKSLSASTKKAFEDLAAQWNDLADSIERQPDLGLPPIDGSS